MKWKTKGTLAAAAALIAKQQPLLLLPCFGHAWLISIGVDRITWSLASGNLLLPYLLHDL
jgi:hypothetical protein